MNPDYSWDLRKSQSNQRKHGVTFDEALTVFADPLARIFDDPDHSAEERREIIIGMSARPRLLLVVIPSGTGTAFVSSVRGAPGRKSELTMKKTASADSTRMRKEYQFDYAEARPNRFASKGAAGRTAAPVSAVVLAPDVARVFNNSAAVNKALRALIRAMPARAE